MGRKLSKPKDPTYDAIEVMVAQSGLNATTQEEVVNYSKLFMKAFLERAMHGEMNHFLKEEVRQASLDFAFSPGIRRLIYTTNAIESLNRTIRKAIKTKGCFSTDEAAKMLVWLSLREVLQKWRRPTRTWSAAMEEMAILYGSRFTDDLEQLCAKSPFTRNF